MEIDPGRGLVGGVSLGESRATVASTLGAPRRERDARLIYDDLVLTFDTDDVLELVEVPYAGATGRQATLDGVQLTARRMEDVVGDLAARGHQGRASDVGWDYPAGFAIFSMASVTLSDLDPSVPEDDDSAVVEGVAVGAPEYFGF